MVRSVIDESRFLEIIAHATSGGWHLTGTCP